MGISDEEIACVFAEGRALAEQAGDRRTLAILTGLYAAARGHLGGCQPDFVRYGEEGARIAAECDDADLRAATATMPMYGSIFTGDGRGVLTWSDRVLAETGEDDLLGKRIFG